MPYASLAQLKDYLGIDSDNDDFLLSECLDRASSFIDSYTGRRFSANTETRYYEDDAVESRTLYLDEDLLSITTLTNGDADATTISSSDYWLIPRQGGPPYYAIRLKVDTTDNTVWEFDTDYWVSVAGTWGWSTTPSDDIIHACLRLGAWYYAQKDAPVFETTVFPDAGIVSVPSGLPADVKQILDQYRRRVG